MKKRNFKLSILSLFLLASSASQARIELPKMFTDNMVLQQKSDAPMWGKATPNKNVKIVTSWNSKTYNIKSDANGNWKLNLETPTAGGPYTISISDGKEIKLNNVLIGEVWICSGQSNMEMPLAGWGQVANYKEEIAKANYPQIRLFHVEQATSIAPLDDLKATRGGWRECSPETVADFSSVAYFFGRNLNQNQNVPIGLISTSWGGTIAEAWTSGDALQLMPDFRDEVKEMTKYTQAEAQVIYDKEIKIWNDRINNADGGMKDGQPVWAATATDDSSWKTMDLPEVWENRGMENFDGIVWFRRTIDIPEEFVGKDLKLKLAMIDDSDITYFNGVQIGATHGFNVQREYTIPAKLVKVGKAVISVRVTDTGGGGGIYGDKSDMALINVSEVGVASISLDGDWKYKVAVDFSQHPPVPLSPSGSANRPTVLYNAMINPIVPYAIKGAIWYQGESNESRGYQYRELFPLLIRDWRNKWNDNFPFYFVQLANYNGRGEQPRESIWAELREAQFQTLKLENTGMAVTIDIGDGKDIHPKNKQDVGLRLALAARAKTYGENIAYSGPIYKSYKIEQGKIRIFFDNTDKGLKAKGSQLKSFAIAGQDHKFYWATATIEGNEIVVSCPEVKYPVAVRYGWDFDPDCNLYNGADLPASPFRTDDWR